MKRGSFHAVSRSAGAGEHRFPRGTLLVSLCLLAGGLRLADVLPLPSFPHPAPALPMPAPVVSEDGPSVSPFTAPPIPARPFTSPGPGSRADLSREPITTADVTFEPIVVPLGALAYRIRAVADKGKVVLTDIRNGVVLWSGPVAAARFVCSDIAASRVLQDSAGRVLWSETPTPDLSLNRGADGRTRLTDRAGETLWEGVLNPSAPLAALPSRSQRQQTTCSVDFAGIKVRGINRYYTLMDDTGRETRVLWSGMVPALRPADPITLLLRDQHRYFFWGADGPRESADRVTTIEMREEAGQVVVTDPLIRMVGRRSVPLLTVTSAVQLVGQERIIPVPCQYYAPSASLKKAGAALFTYRNTLGNVVLTNSVVRDGSRQRINNNLGKPL